MPDLFLINEQFLLAKWDHLLSVFRIVTRDSQRRGELTPTADAEMDAPDDPVGGHRCVIRQTVSDLIELEADLIRMGQDSPVDKLNARWQHLWQMAVAWVREERRWRFPHPRLPDDEARADVNRRAPAERAFFDAIASAWPDRTNVPAPPTGDEPAADDEPVADQPVSVTRKCGPVVAEATFHITSTPIASRG